MGPKKRHSTSKAKRVARVAALRAEPKPVAVVPRKSPARKPRLRQDVPVESPVPAKVTKLAAWRDLMGMTRAEMAEKMGVTVPYYGRVENGQSFPRPIALLALKAATNGQISADDVLGDLVSLDA
jgi:DNA-binding XRE family transcriptional regulator